jgi:colicin import membrane protein
MGLHVAIIIAFTVKTVLFADPEPIDYSAAIRVDMVALPEKISEQQQLPPKQEDAKPETKPEPLPPKPVHKEVVVEKPVKAPKKDVEAINLNKDKNKQKEALEKLKAMSAIEKMKEEVEKESKKVAGVGNKKAAPVTVKGNILSPGTALTGLNRLQVDSYLSSLDQQIKQNWFLPEWLAKKPFRTQVRLKIDEKGRVLSREVVLSSGNSSYDDLALETIDKSAPFEPPPEKFVSIVAVNGLVIGFPE